MLEQAEQPALQVITNHYQLNERCGECHPIRERHGFSECLPVLNHAGTITV